MMEHAVNSNSKFIDCQNISKSFEQKVDETVANKEKEVMAV